MSGKGNVYFLSIAGLSNRRGLSSLQLVEKKAMRESFGDWAGCLLTILLVFLAILFGLVGWGGEDQLQIAIEDNNN